MLVISSPLEDLKSEIMISYLQNLNNSYIASPVTESSLSTKGPGFQFFILIETRQLLPLKRNLFSFN